MFSLRARDRATPGIWQCLAFALPALLLGAVLRFSYVAAVPEPFVTPDTNSYLATGFDLWTKGEFDMPAKRRWVYPALVALAPLLPGSIAQAVAAAQHFLGLGVILAVAWIVGQLTCFWRLWIPLATLLTAAWPALLVFEHTFLADGVFGSAFVLTAALSLPVHELRQPHRLSAFLIALTLLVGLRPSGRAMWLAALILLVMVARERKAWRRQNIALAILCSIVAFTTGSDRMGSRLLLSSVLPLVDLEKTSHQEYREALRPLVVEARAHGTDYPWAQSRFKTRVNDPEEKQVGEAWKRLMKDEKEFGRMCKVLAIETVLRHPILFTRFTLMKVLIASAAPADDVRARAIPWQFNVPGVWHEQAKLNERFWEKNGERMSWIYGGMDWPQWQAMAAERSQRKLWFRPLSGWIDSTFPWAILQPRSGAAGEVKIAWFGWLALAGLLVSLLPRHFLRGLMLWLSMLIYLGLTFGVGDCVPRFAVPVHWCGIVLACLALDAAFQVCWRIAGHWRGKAATIRPEEPLRSPPGSW